jgi:Flp pilus assembly protein TadG
MNACPDRREDEGAAAVEFAVLLPLLVLLLGGIIDLGLMLNAEISLTHAAREGARVEAIGTGDPITTAGDAFVAPATHSFNASVAEACPGATARARLVAEATYDAFVLQIFIPSLSEKELSSEAVMRCNG